MISGSREFWKCALSNEFGTGIMRLHAKVNGATSRYSRSIRYLALPAVWAVCAALAVAQTGPGATCLQCHSSIQTALQRKVKHAAVEMGCESCHTNHREEKSAEGKANHYLSGKEAEVCSTCHDFAEKTLIDAHKGQPFAKAACSGCHDPHASDKPKLIVENLHGPFAAGQCEGCHKAPNEGKIVLTAASSSELCFGCHSGVRDKLNSAKSKHTLLTTDPNSCTDCHDPHASRHKKALKQPATALCTGCHAEVLAAKKFVHKPVEDNCALCHDAHASDHAKLLHAPVQALCLECHDASAMKKFTDAAPVSLFGGKVTLPPQPYQGLKMLLLRGGKGHPMMGHPVSAPATAGKPGFDCVTCHMPHAANGSPQLLITDTPSTNELCVRCHK